LDGVPGAGGQSNGTHKNGKMAGKVDSVPSAGIKKTIELIKMEKWREK
jgi:hypothetical protein